MVEFKETKHKQNYISADSKTAISSYGEIYEIGEEVGNTHNELSTAVINSFEIDRKTNEVKAHTDQGWQHLDFLRKV